MKYFMLFAMALVIGFSGTHASAEQMSKKEITAAIKKCFENGGQWNGSDLSCSTGSKEKAERVRKHMEKRTWHGSTDGDGNPPPQN